MNQLMNSRVLGILLALIIGPLVAAPASAAGGLGAPERQETQPVFALPGTLSVAQEQPFGTYLTTGNSQVYGIVGKTPEVEQQIETYKQLGEDVRVKVWGTMYPNGRLSTTPEIVVSSIQSDADIPDIETEGPEESFPGTGTSVAIVRVDIANVRSGPGTGYTVTGQLVLNQVCPITGRVADNTWWQIDCASGVAGWISDSIVRTVADSDRIPIIAVAAPQPPAVVAPPQPVQPVYNGWKASYFANRSLQGVPVVVQDVAEINFGWGTGSPHPSVPSDNFSATYERTINFASGNYRFTATYDDGVRVYLDGQLIIDDWHDGSVRSLSADRTLNGNHSLRVEYYEATGNASLSFGWAIVSGGGGGSGKTNPEDWDATYYTNPNLAGSPALVRVESRSPYPLDKDWGSGSPAPGIIPNDNFSARYVARYYFEAGDFTFKARVDDGVRVRLDGHTVIDTWGDGFKEPQNTFFGVGAGQHEIVVEYYERSGDAFVRVFWWRETGDSGGNGGYGNRDE